MNLNRERLCWPPLLLLLRFERMFDRATALARIDANICACPGCSGELTDSARSRGGWRFCRICHCAWKISTIDRQDYATAIHSPIHTLAPTGPRPTEAS